MKKDIRSSIFRDTHASVAQMIAGQHEVSVISEGTRFYNRADFRLVGVVKWLMELQNQRFSSAWKPRWEDLYKELSKLNGRVKAGCDQIVIAATPEELDPFVESALEGGLKHEVAHTRWSLKGPVDRWRLMEIIQRQWDPTVPYFKGLSSYFNIVEDGFIERRAVDWHPGARHQLFSLALFVVQQEQASRKGGARPDAWSLFSCCFRDAILNPIYKPDHIDLEDVYGRSLSTLVLTLLDKEIADVDLVTDSYGSLELAFRVLNKVFRALNQGNGAGAGGGANAEVGSNQGGCKGDDRKGEGLGTGNCEPMTENETENHSDTQVKNGAIEGGGQPSSEQQMLSQVLGAAAEEPKILDNNGALEGFVQHMNQQLLTDAVRDVHVPYTRRFDVVEDVEAEDQGLYETERERSLAATFDLRERFVSLLKGNKERSRVQRGLDRGRLDAGRIHKVRTHDQPKVFKKKRAAVALDASVMLAVDESGSMEANLSYVRQTVIAVAESCAQVNIPTYVFGFGSHQRGLQDLFSSLAVDLRSVDIKVLQEHVSDLGKQFTRVEPVCYRVFKKWHETYHHVATRFATFQADSKTPLVDAVEYAIQEMSRRKTSRRLVFVLTDGAPDYAFCEGWSPAYPCMIKRLCRLAAENGIEVIGVGVGVAAHYVVSVFPDHVWVRSFDQLSVKLTEKLSQLVLEISNDV